MQWKFFIYIYFHHHHHHGKQLRHHCYCYCYSFPFLVILFSQDRPQDFVPFRGGCIRFFLTPTITFEAARSFCMSFKTKDNKLGDLIEIRSLEENAEVVYLAPDNGTYYKNTV